MNPVLIGQKLQVSAEDNAGSNPVPTFSLVRYKPSMGTDHLGSKQLLHAENLTQTSSRVSLFFGFEQIASVISDTEISN